MSVCPIAGVPLMTGAVTTCGADPAVPATPLLVDVASGKPGFLPVAMTEMILPTSSGEIV